MEIGDKVKHDLTGITGEITKIHKNMVTFYSNGHYINALSDTLEVIEEKKWNR